MQVIITDAKFARSRAIHLSGVHLGLVLVVLLMGAAAMGAWLVRVSGHASPVGAQGLTLSANDQARQTQVHIDTMARKLGEMQARVMQMESLSERVMGLAGITQPPAAKRPGQGGLLIPGGPLSMGELDAAMDALSSQANQRVDWLTVAESRLFDQHVRKHMIPTQAPVEGRGAGSSFGWRVDPFTGHSALHTGLDFSADTGVSILAAAGGVVVTQEWHSAYGKMVEIDHGNQLVTRYAHASKTLVKQGDIVRRGQKIAEVGTTGRSTGPHLHFEVLVQGVPQDPQKFLSMGTQVADSKPSKGVELSSRLARR